MRLMRTALALLLLLTGCAGEVVPAPAPEAVDSAPQCTAQIGEPCCDSGAFKVCAAGVQCFQLDPVREPNTYTCAFHCGQEGESCCGGIGPGATWGCDAGLRCTITAEPPDGSSVANECRRP